MSVPAAPPADARYAGTRHDVVVIGGATASGKSGLALALAAQCNGVVINADSMQIYDGLSILTAHPARDDYTAAPHALYGVLAPDDACSAARWRRMALTEIDKAHAAGKLPVIVGGTGLYIRALIDGLSPIPDVPPAFRAAAVERQRVLGNPAFHAELAAMDPATAATLDPMNSQRVIRAREVLDATGKGLAAWHSAPREKPPAHLRFVMVTLLPARDRLYANCATRFDVMLQNGALAQAQDFRDKMAGGTSPLDKALGYPELCDYMDGKCTLEAAAAHAVQMTRNYAKRQSTWFRNQIKPDLALTTPDVAAVAALLRPV